jgi:putative inorganic carbon (hco3(-)) transporter
MGLTLVLMYVVLYLLSVVEIFPEIAPYRPMVILSAVTTFVSVVTFVVSGVAVKLRTQLVLMILLVGFILVSLVLHGWFGGVLVAFLSLMPNVIIYFLGIVHFSSTWRLSVLRLALVLVALYVIAMGISEVPLVLATETTTPYVMGDGLGGVRIRGLGFLNDPNAFGQFLVMLLPMLFVSSKPRGMGTGYLLALPVAGIFLYGIYLTNSRGTALGTVLLVVLYMKMRFKKVGMAAAGMVGLSLVVLLNATRSRTISVSTGEDRLTIWSNGLGMFKSSPIWGVGYGNFRSTSELTAHNSYMLAASELGLIGLMLWMSVMVVTILLLRRVGDSKPVLKLADAPVGQPLVAAVAGGRGGPGNSALLPHSDVPNPLEADPGIVRWAVALKLSLYSYLFTSFFLSRTYDLPLYLLLGMCGATISMAGGEPNFPIRDSKWAIWSCGLSFVAIFIIYVLVRMRWA